jgi:hypothetical protein
MATTGRRPNEEVEKGCLGLAGLLERMRSADDGFAVGIPYTEGQVAALRWLSEPAASSPLTLSPGKDPEDVREIDREADLATDMLHGRVPMDLRGRSFVAGVEFALMWARYQTVDPEL